MRRRGRLARDHPLWRDRKFGENNGRLVTDMPGNGRDSRIRGFQIEMKDASEFFDSLRKFTGAVWAWDDEFGLSAVEMRTPIWNNAVGAVRRVAFAPVADDRMIGNTNGHLVHDEKRGIFRG